MKDMLVIQVEVLSGQFDMGEWGVRGSVQSRDPDFCVNGIKMLFKAMTFGENTREWREKTDEPLSIVRGWKDEK